MTPTTPMKSTIQIAAATLAALLLVTLLPAMSAANDLRLIDAVQRQDSEAVRMLLLDLDTDEDGIDINTRRADGVTALAWAAHWDDIDTARLLVEAGADPNTANDLDVAPLMLASTNRSLPMVELLLASGADPNHARPNGETALMCAARAGEVQVTRALLEARADINAQTSRGFTPLIFAAAEGHGAVAAVLAETGADLSARTDAIVPKRSGYGRRGATADAEPRRLRDNQALLISQLPQDGDGEPRRPQGGFTPLLYAAMSGDLETVQVLVSAGADVNETAPDGGTPLLVALMRGTEEGLWRRPGGRNQDVAIYLLEHGADPNLAEAGYTALHVASATRQHRAVTTLLAHGANPNDTQFAKPQRFLNALIPGDGYLTTGWVSQIGATPFMLAAKSVDVPMMRLLVEHGADPQLAADGGANALMLAAGLAKRHASDVGYFVWEEDQAIEAITLAIELGLDVNAATDRGETALHGATRHAAHDVIEFLVARGADIDALTWADQTPLRVAEGYLYSGTYVSYPETAELLRQLGADTDAGTQLNFGLTSYGDKDAAADQTSGNPQP
ncbi:MAG: ankyrin repeat domain-containing protein [Vicinamibacterales bacterium]